MIDLVESQNNDLVLGVNGDIAVTDSMEDIIYQLIKTIVSTPPNDASILPYTSFDEDEFLGNKIISSLLRNIENSIRTTITDSTTLYPFQFTVSAFQVSEILVGVVIKVLGFESETSLRLAFDTVEGGVIAYLYKEELTENSKATMTIPLQESKLKEIL